MVALGEGGWFGAVHTAELQSAEVGWLCFPCDFEIRVVVDQRTMMRASRSVFIYREARVGTDSPEQYDPGYLPPRRYFERQAAVGQGWLKEKIEGDSVGF